MTSGGAVTTNEPMWRKTFRSPTVEPVAACAVPIGRSARPCTSGSADSTEWSEAALGNQRPE
jgi:hypothetical protein